MKDILKSKRFFYTNASEAIVRTPEDLVKDMISRIPDHVFESPTTTFLDPACGKGTFLRNIAIILKEKGHSAENIKSRIFGIDIDVRSGVKQPQHFFGKENIIVDDFLTMSKPKEWPDKFDVIVSNPPYSKYLHIKFLEKCSNMAKEKVVFVHPSNSFINTKGGNKTYVDINNFIEDKLESVTLFNGNKLFGIDLYTPCSITLVNPNGNNGRIKVSNMLTGEEYLTPKISGITQFRNSNELWSLKSKIDSYVNKKGSIDSILGKKSKGDYMVEFTRIRGHADSKGEMNQPMAKDDFYTYFKKDIAVKENSDPKYDLWFRFETDREAINFIKYLKTDFARYALAMYKFAQSLNNGELRFVPLMDFSKEWDDDKLADHFSLSQGERDFIKEIITPFYD